jgi:RNA polymerase sigma-70 factor (ECF subfamily)
MHGRGPYVLQAAIASLQLEPEIDWPQIAALYAKLYELTRSPVVELNRAVAIAEGGDPQGALDLVDGLELGDYRYLHSTRAELLRRLGRVEEALGVRARSAAGPHRAPERRFLARRLAELGSR